MRNRQATANDHLPGMLRLELAVEPHCRPLYLRKGEPAQVAGDNNLSGLLIRVGADLSCGNANGPIRMHSGEFVYVPIPEGDQRVDQNFGTRYDALAARVTAMVGAGRDVSPWLPSRDWTHLDPDFDHLTYGNNENVKATRLAQLKPGDFLAFYASLRAVDQPGTLVYALIGLITVDRIVKADTISDTERHLNAHTRRTPVVASDVVIFGVPELSGRLERAIPIGEYRDRAYRVRVDLLETWGGLTANDGYIQRSAVPPGFVDSTRFMAWLKGQRVPLVARNWD